MLSRFAGRPRHQQTFRSPLVLSAVQPAGMLRARSTPAVASFVGVDLDRREESFFAVRSTAISCRAVQQRLAADETSLRSASPLKPATLGGRGHWSRLVFARPLNAGQRAACFSLSRSTTITSMGLLLVFQGEEEAPGHHVDMGLDAWHALMTAAKSSKGGFPLIRRLNDYYRDALFEEDELAALLSELECLRARNCASADPILVLVRAALVVERGISVIAD